MWNIRKGVEIMARYIDYDKALSFPLANGEYDKENANENFIMGCETYKEWLENQPTEEVIPIVRGKWLNVSKSVRDDYLGDVNFAECSVCHSIRVADYFCSCCGADMRKMEESEKNNNQRRTH